jgi:hypothetical protein
MCRCKHEQNVLFLKHYYASKSFPAVHKAFSNAYPDKEVPNKTRHRLVRKFWVCDKSSLSHKTAKITARLISSSASAATLGYGCRNY